MRVCMTLLIGLLFSLTTLNATIAWASDSPPPTQPDVSDNDQPVGDSGEIQDNQSDLEPDNALPDQNEDTGETDKPTEEESVITEETEDPATMADHEDGMVSSQTDDGETQTTEANGEANPVVEDQSAPEGNQEQSNIESETNEEVEPIKNDGTPSEDNQDLPTDKSEYNEEDTHTQEDPDSIIVPDPYFYVNGDKHSFLPEGGNCSGVVNCQVSTTPIQDALNAVSGGLTPDDQTIYIEGGIYLEDITINEMEDFTLQGAADGNPSTLAGVVSIVDSLNITLRDMIFAEYIQINGSKDVTIEGTDGDDEIDVDLDGTVENLNIEGGTGNDAITVNLDADNSDVHVEGGLGEDDLTITTGADTQLSENQALSDEQQVRFDESLESINIEVSGEDNEVQVDGEVNVPGGQVSIKNPGGDVIVTSQGNLDVSNDAEKGGKIDIKAERIASFGSITADGENEGGKIHILANDIVVIGNNARIIANASLKGDGGEILVIGQRHAAVASSAILEAKGGSLGGDGGFIETSGYQSFDIGAIPDVSAAKGNGGEWLLDPANDIEVISGSSNTNIDETSGAFTTTGDSAKIGVNNVVSALGSGNVTITTGTVGSPPSGNGNVNWKADMEYTGTTDRTLTVNAIGNFTNNNKIEAKNAKLNIVLNADSDQDGTGSVDIQGNLISNGGDITIIGYDVGFNSNIQTGGGDLTLTPSKDDIPAGFGTGAGGGFYIGLAEFAWLSLPNGQCPIGRSTSTNDMEIGTVSVTNFNMVILGKDVIFKGELTSTNRSVQINATGDIKDGNGASNDVKLDLAIAYLLVDAKGAFGTSADPIETTLSNFASESDSGGVFLTNTGGLKIDSTGRLDGQTGQSGIFIDGIISHGGVTIIANSPLRVSRAIREKAGGDINLTAGNDSTKLGDDLTIEADVVVEGTTGRITGNAGDDIKTEASTNVSAPEGVNFNADLDGNADNGGGNATISGTVQATKSGATVNINAANGVNLTSSGRIITQGGNVILSAANGTVTQNGTITLNGGTLKVIEKPPDPIAGVTVFIDPDTGEVTITAADADSAAAAAVALALASNPVLTITSGQPVDLLTTTAFGDTVALQLPEGNGATFINGIPATVTMTAGAEVVLPAELPEGFDMLDSLEIAVDTELTEDELGGILVSFGLPADTALDELVILQYVEGEGWVEVPLEESLNGMIEALSETGGVFVLAQANATAEAAAETAAAETGNGSAQAAATLSGNTNEPAVLELNQGDQITISGGAGDAVSAVGQTLENLPGNLAGDLNFLSGMSVDVTQGASQVSILPNGEGIEVTFDIPEGVSPQDVVILYWLDVLNGGQGGWQELTPEITTDGRATLQTFFGGTFVLANR